VALTLLILKVPPLEILAVVAVNAPYELMAKLPVVEIFAAPAFSVPGVTLVPETAMLATDIVAEFPFNIPPLVMLKVEVLVMDVPALKVPATEIVLEGEIAATPLTDPPAETVNVVGLMAAPALTVPVTVNPLQ